jgi:hypothetical protein
VRGRQESGGRLHRSASLRVMGACRSRKVASASDVDVVALQRKRYRKLPGCVLACLLCLRCGPYASTYNCNSVGLRVGAAQRGMVGGAACLVHCGPRWSRFHGAWRHPSAAEQGMPASDAYVVLLDAVWVPNQAIPGQGWDVLKDFDKINGATRRLPSKCIAARCAASRSPTALCCSVALYRAQVLRHLQENRLERFVVSWRDATWVSASHCPIVSHTRCAHTCAQIAGASPWRSSFPTFVPFRSPSSARASSRSSVRGRCDRSCLVAVSRRRELSLPRCSQTRTALEKSTSGSLYCTAHASLLSVPRAVARSPHDASRVALPVPPLHAELCGTCAP